MLRDARGAAYREQMSALLDERFQLRDRARDGDGARAWRVFARKIRRYRRHRSLARWNRIRRKNHHVVARVEIAGVECLRIDDFERKLVALQQPPDPAALNRAAIA